MLLTAEARTGKSTLCQHAVLHCDQETPWFPIFLRFADFSRSGKDLQAFLQENHVVSLGLAGVTVLIGSGASGKEVSLGE